jgi:hypothetical protein
MPRQVRTAAWDRDHGITVAGGCEAKSESLAHGDLFVVMGHLTTFFRGQGRTSRQAHLTQESQWPRPVGREEPDDHGSTGGGQQQGHDHDAGGSGELAGAAGDEGG